MAGSQAVVWRLDTDLCSIGQTRLEDDAKPLDPALSVRRAPRRIMHRAEAVLWILEPRAVLNQEPDHLSAFLVRLSGADRRRQGRRASLSMMEGCSTSRALSRARSCPQFPFLSSAVASTNSCSAAVISDRVRRHQFNLSNTSQTQARLIRHPILSAARGRPALPTRRPQLAQPARTAMTGSTHRPPPGPADLLCLC